MNVLGGLSSLGGAGGVSGSSSASASGGTFGDFNFSPGGKNQSLILAAIGVALVLVLMLQRRRG